MKLSRLDRRDFIEGMLLLGLTACAGPRTARNVLKASPSTEGGLGPFFRSIDRLPELSFGLRRRATRGARRLRCCKQDL